MKITIWIHKSEAISGKITTWYNNCPNDLFWKDYVQVTISQDEFTNLVDDNGLICSIPEGLEYDTAYTLDEIKEAMGKEENLFKDEEQLVRDASYYDRTRNMSPDQAQEVYEKTGLTPQQPFAMWYEGLSPIEQAKWNNGYNLEN